MTDALARTGGPAHGTYVLFDVDGTLIDAVANQRRVWATWAERYGLDVDEVHRVALRTRPVETFAQVAADRDPRACLALLHALEDEDVRSGHYAAFDGAARLLRELPAGAWALVTSNYEHRVRGRFLRTGLPVPEVVVDAAAVEEGKPSPAPYLLAAARLGAAPEDCLVVEDAPSGVEAGLRAGMTVWGVNAAVAVKGVHRHFTGLREAVPHILAHASARGRAVGSSRRQAVGSSGSGSSLPDAGRDRGASP
ncbi:haloacid dehalogenase [Streptomyces longispororuber]|uniref:Haloacid dehalogenase n=1 Tax=Streptomyces longispororuber TaxID=68230 RepID=A0A918Z4H5_9ACTN|nr:HAD-IA family hydrolase [Streptomyces longispororuber]GHE35693.1 haloacid dehalogenase [Streptomyces longispororuber]